MNRQPHPIRIHIIGGVGNGKTTLAKQLSSHFNTPHYELDRVAFKRTGHKQALYSRLEVVRSIAAQPSWVTDGAYLWWTEELLATADLIVWLDLPFNIIAWRIVQRYRHWRSLGLFPLLDWPRFALFFLRAMQFHFAASPKVPQAPDDDRALTRIATAQTLNGYAHKVIRCTTPGEVAQVRERLLGRQLQR